MSVFIRGWQSVELFVFRAQVYLSINITSIQYVVTDMVKERQFFEQALRWLLVKEGISITIHTPSLYVNHHQNS